MLTNDVLIDTYQKALELDLEPDFIQLLLHEIRRRDLKVSSNRRGA